VFHLEASYHASQTRWPWQWGSLYWRGKVEDTISISLPSSQSCTAERIFAWEKATGSYLNLDDKALNRCIQAGNKYFCNEDKVVMQGTPQTSLAAVWLQEWSGIKLMCHLWLRPAISSARKINSTHTVVTAPEDMEVRVQCPDSPKLVRHIRGQWWLAMSAGCKGSTSSWKIVAKDKVAVKEETVVVSVHTNVTAWTGKALNFTLDMPAPLQSITSNILQALRESESRLPVKMMVDIGVAATSVVVVTSFLFITYVKFKKFSVTSRNSGVSEAAVAWSTAVYMLAVIS
jgi:hypothetical protein